jgi:hypothetical protein
MQVLSIAFWWCLKKLADVLASKTLPLVWESLKKKLSEKEPGIVTYYRRFAETEQR